LAIAADFSARFHSRRDPIARMRETGFALSAEKEKRPLKVTFFL
jgi:hypothetical protein